MRRFAFDFSSPLSVPLRLLGVGPRSASVHVDEGHLDVRFGPWHLRTPVANIRAVDVTGPFNPLLATGVRVGLRDRSLTFGTSPRHGVAISFHRAVPSPVPGYLLRHPSLTVTVEEPDALAEEILRVGRDDVDRSQSDPSLVHQVEAVEHAEELRERRVRREARLAERAKEQRREQAREGARRRAAARRRTAASSSSAATTSDSASASEGTATKRAAGKRAASNGTPTKRTATNRTATKRTATKRTATGSSTSPTAKRTPGRRSPQKQTAASAAS